MIGSTRRRASVATSNAGAAHARRRGFTIIELLVAIIIITVGLLALASGSAATVRQMMLAQQQTQASFLAQSRMETIRAANRCVSFPSSSGNTATTRGFTETWGASALANTKTNAMIVADTVSYTVKVNTSVNGSGVQTKRYIVQSIMPCK